MNSNLIDKVRFKVISNTITRIVVFIHPGQLKSGNLFYVTVTDEDPERLESMLKQYKDAICLYNGPPNKQET